MVGAGLFSVMGLGVKLAGNAVYVSFLAAGIIAMLSAYSFAKLSQRFSHMSSLPEFILKGFGDTILSGGLNLFLWIGYMFAVALYARAFASFAVTFFPNTESTILTYVFINGIVLFFVGTEVAGARAVGRVEIVIVVAKMVILIALGAFGIKTLELELLNVSNWPGPSSIIVATGVLFLGYEGFGLIVSSARDMYRPRKTIPRALFISITLVIVVYVLVAIALVGNLSVSTIVDHQHTALQVVSESIAGQIGLTIITITALFSTASAINATLYGGANASYMLAKNGEIIGAFERKTWRSIREGLFITSAIILLLANLISLEGIALVASGIFLIVYGSINIAHLRIYKQTLSNRKIIIVSIAFVSLAFLFFFYYLVLNSPEILIIIFSIIALSLAIELFMRKVFNRRLKSQKVEDQEPEEK